MLHPFFTLDVFTGTAFAGNPLAVVLGASDLTDRQMQTVAREFNLSETVFVTAPKNPDNRAKIRIFMPTGELPFAGHPTIGTAVLLASLDLVSAADCNIEILLEEQVGLVPVQVSCTDGEWTGTLSTAVMPKPAGEPPSRELLARSIGLEKEAIGLQDHAPGLFDAGVPYLFVPLRDLDALNRAAVSEPAWSEMTAAAGTDGAYLYTTGDNDQNWRARLYAPAAGIPEDPATGSAAAAFPGQLNAAHPLADGTHYWTIGQGIEMGRASDIALQADVVGGKFKAVRVGGKAVSISRGMITI
jgi:trans-2,3-dihydro-3-hydroxyanthranilate isomerase